MYPIPKIQVASPSLSRRDFLRLAGLVSTALVVSSCQPKTATQPTLAPTTAITKTPVAISRVHTYDRATVEKQVQMLIEQLGGLSDVVKPGDSVAIKPNLTGGVNSGQLKGLAPVETFITHPEVVRALVKQMSWIQDVE